MSFGLGLLSGMAQRVTDKRDAADEERRERERLALKAQYEYDIKASLARQERLMSAGASVGTLKAQIRSQNPDLDSDQVDVVAQGLRPYLIDPKSGGWNSGLGPDDMSRWIQFGISQFGEKGSTGPSLSDQANKAMQPNPAAPSSLTQPIPPLSGGTGNYSGGSANGNTQPNRSTGISVNREDFRIKQEGGWGPSSNDYDEQAYAAALARETASQTASQKEQTLVEDIRTQFANIDPNLITASVARTLDANKSFIPVQYKDSKTGKKYLNFWKMRSNDKDSGQNRIIYVNINKPGVSVSVNPATGFSRLDDNPGPVNGLGAAPDPTPIAKMRDNRNGNPNPAHEQGMPLDPAGFPIDLNRPIVTVDGQYATERSVTMEVDGRWYNLPSIWDGKIIDSDEEILNRASKIMVDNPDYYPNFATREEALAAALKRSDAINTQRQGELEELEGRPIEPSTNIGGGRPLDQQLAGQGLTIEEEDQIRSAGQSLLGFTVTNAEVQALLRDDPSLKGFFSDPLAWLGTSVQRIGSDFDIEVGEVLNEDKKAKFNRLLNRMVESFKNYVRPGEEGTSRPLKASYDRAEKAMEGASGSTTAGQMIEAFQQVQTELFRSYVNLQKEAGRKLGYTEDDVNAALMKDFQDTYGLTDEEAIEFTVQVLKRVRGGSHGSSILDMGK